MGNGSKTERNITIDILRLVMAYFIVMIHVQLFYEESAMGFLVTRLVIIAVPFFSIVGGYYFHKSHAQGNGVVRVIFHYVKILLFWNSIWYLRHVIFNLFNGELIIDPNFFFANLFDSQLWYVLGTIVWILLVSLVLRLTKRNKSGYIILGIVAIVLIFAYQIIVPYYNTIASNRMQTWINGTENGGRIKRIFMSGFPCWILGVLIEKYKITLDKWINSKRSKLLFLGACIIYIAENCIIWKMDLAYDKMMSAGPYYIVAALFIMCIYNPCMISTDERHAIVCKKLSATIYFTHAIIITLLPFTHFIIDYSAANCFILTCMLSTGLGIIYLWVIRVKKLVSNKASGS